MENLKRNGTEDYYVERYCQEFHDTFNKEDLCDKVQNFIRVAFAAGRLQGIPEAEGVVPKSLDMQVAIDTGSDAGAGHVIGFDDCRKQTLDNIAKLKEGK